MHMYNDMVIGRRLLVNYYGNVKTCTKMAVERLESDQNRGSIVFEGKKKRKKPNEENVQKEK